MTTAVVIGGGFAGLVCAQTLAEHFGRVIVLEKGPFEPDITHSATPQAHHLHVLLQRGRQVLEGIFPGLDAEIAAFGCEEVDWGGDTVWLSRHGFLPRYETGIKTRPCSRSLLDHLMRKRVAANPKIDVIKNFYAQRVVVNGRGRADAIEDRHGVSVAGDFFVEACGRTSLFATLREKERSLAPVIYSSCYVRGFKPQEDEKQIYIQVGPGVQGEGGVIMPVENGKHILTLISRHRAAPSDANDFVAHTRGLRDQRLYRAVCEAEVVSPVKKFYHASGYRMTWQAPMPTNLIVVGDASCVFNPVYGQGMTVAALCAERVGSLFARGHLPEQEDISQLTRSPWMLAASEDLTLHGLRGRPLPLVMTSVVFNGFLRSATYARCTHKLFLEILHMMRPVERGFARALVGERL